MKIPVGAFAGHLVADGTFYPVEEIDVKHYTFEVDLYLKDGKLIKCLPVCLLNVSALIARDPWYMCR